MKILGGHYLSEDDLRSAGLTSVGRNVRVHSTAILVDLERISFGSNVRVDPYCVISASGGYVRIGSYVHVASHAILVGGAGIELRDFAGLSQGVRIYSVSDDYSGESLTNPTIPAHLLKLNRGAVLLGRHVIIGSGSVLLPGASIGDGSSVGALSVIHKALPEWGIYAGTPARKIRDRSRAFLASEQELTEKLTSAG